MKIIFLILPLLLFADEFENDLAALKKKYKTPYHIEEISKWQERVKEETFYEKFHKLFRQADFYAFLNTYFFQGKITPDIQINAQLSTIGPSLDILAKIGKPFDLYLYGGVGFSQDVWFLEGNQNYPVDNNYLWGLGIYFFNKYPKISPFFSLELQAQSFLGANNEMDFSTVNALSEIQGKQLSSLNFCLGVDIPLKLWEKIGKLRLYLTPALLANTTTYDNSYSENVSEVQYGLEISYKFFNPMLLKLGYRGGTFQGENRESYNLISLNLGFRY